MKYIFICCAIVCMSCDGEIKKVRSIESDTSSEVVFVNEPLPDTRSSVSLTPAAEYTEKIPDELNDWKFYVALYETKRRFHYTLRIQCKELRTSDSLNIPNFGTEPKVEIHKGKEPLTAIIGFLDKKNVFREYKEAGFKSDRLRVRTLQTYSVGVYRTKTSSER